MSKEIKVAATAAEILIEQGATFRKTITVKDSSGAIIDVSGWVGLGMVKAKATDTTPLAEFTFDFSDGALGKVHFELSATDTDAIPTTGEKFNQYTKLVYDVELVDGARVYRAANGDVKVSPSSTK